MDGSDPATADNQFSQGTRFATLLLYLNEDGLEGGETSFPKYVNAESFDQLRVKPEEGKVCTGMAVAVVQPTVSDCWLNVVIRLSCSIQCSATEI